MKTKKLFYILVIMLFLWGCMRGSTVRDIEPIINSTYKDAKAVFYPSTDFKVAAVIVDEKGDVYYVRLNGFGNMRDQKKLFNVNEYCHK